MATLTLLMSEALVADPLIVKFPFGLATVEESAGDDTAVVGGVSFPPPNPKS